MRAVLASLSVLATVLGLAACQGQPLASPSAAPPAAPTAATRPAAVPVASQPSAAPAVQAQVDRGRALFARNCATCHGAAGQGTDRGPVLIGPGALPEAPRPGSRIRRGAFRTAMDLGMFIKNSMPPVGQHLPPTDVAAVLGFVLQSNGITPPQTLSPSTAGAIRLR